MYDDQYEETIVPNDAVAVDCLLDANGRVTVRSITWNGQELEITATGRQWQEEAPAGVTRHVLVMSADNTTFELCLDSQDMLWHVRRTWSPGFIV